MTQDEKIAEARTFIEWLFTHGSLEGTEDGEKCREVYSLEEIKHKDAELVRLRDLLKD